MSASPSAIKRLNFIWESTDFNMDRNLKLCLQTLCAIPFNEVVFRHTEKQITLTRSQTDVVAHN